MFLFQNDNQSSRKESHLYFEETVNRHFEETVNRHFEVKVNHHFEETVRPSFRNDSLGIISKRQFCL